MPNIKIQNQTYNGVDQVKFADATTPSLYHYYLDTTASTPAAAGDILSGKHAFVNDTEVTGSMPNNGANGFTITSTATTTIPAGYYNGNGEITVDAGDLAAENIVQGATILGVPGTHTCSVPTYTATSVDAAHVVSGETFYSSTGGTNLQRGTGTLANYLVNPYIFDSSDDTLVVDDEMGMFIGLQFASPKAIGTGADSVGSIHVGFSDLASSIGLTSSKIVSGETIIGVPGSAVVPTIEQDVKTGVLSIL